MESRDWRKGKINLILLITITAINLGMELQKLDSGFGTRVTWVAVMCSGIALGILLFVLIRIIWTSEA